MADIPEDSAGQSQAHGCGSYPLSFPSEPPDIRNWFSSYQYESPEVPELDAVPGGIDGSETQDPLEHRARGHSAVKHANQDNSDALKGGCIGSRSEHGEVSATREFLPLGRGKVEQGPKRKRSLREWFGAGFLDDHDEGTQTESRVVSPVQKSAVDPMCNFNWIGLQNRKCSHDGAELPADSDGTILADTQENHPGGQENDHINWPVSCGGTFNWVGLRNRKRNHEGAVEHSELLTDSDSTIKAETQGNPQGCQETDHTKWPVNCAGNFNWIGLRNFEGAVEQSELLADSDSTIIAETQEYLTGGQVSNRSKRRVNFGGTSLADIEEGFLEDGIEHSKGLADAEKPKRSLRELFGAGFFDDPNKTNDSETQLESTVQRNAVEPLSKSNAVRLPHIEHAHESTARYSKLLANCDVVSSAETQDLPGGQVIEHIGLPVNCGGTGLAADTEGFLEDCIEHSKLPANSDSTAAADIEKTGIEHSILHANHTVISSAVTEERSGGDETNPAKPTLNHKKAEATVAADGFIAIKTKAKPAEECRANKIPKPSRARQTAPLQENRGILESPNALAGDRTKSPLSDRTNLSEVAGAPAPEISGKWKCPRKGKPYVAPPMKQLRLEQWVRRMN